MAGKNKANAEKPAREPVRTPMRQAPDGPIALSPADVSRLTAVQSPRDLRRDLHLFLDYVRGRSIKRSVRGNSLPRADVARLAKLLNDPEPAEETLYSGRMRWLDFVDYIAHRLGLVEYDTAGVYAGYSSSEKSYPDNYMTVAESAYTRFLARSLAEQERQLLELLTQDYRPDEYGVTVSEFFSPSVVGRLDTFSTYGSATGVMATLQFAPIREFLLEILAHCAHDVWLSTAALVAYLKADHPYFMNTPGRFVDRYGRPGARFTCFHESTGSPYDQGDDIPDDAPDAFERVEGRYVERFLEGIPLLLGYVDVAYGENRNPHRFPSRDVLQAFRVKTRLVRSLRGQIAEPTVTVQPNLEIYIQAEVYPARVLAQLTPLADVVSSDVVTILKLRREKVAAALIQNERLNIIGLLEGLNGRELPQNVARELQEWTEHSSRFTLYVNYALWEGQPGENNLPANLAGQAAEEIAPGIRLVSSAGALYAELERAARMPMWIKHGDAAFARVPEGARTIFRRQTAIRPAAPAEKPLVEVKRETQITLHFPTAEVWDVVRKALVDARCSIAADRALRTITYMRRYEPQVTAVLAADGSNQQSAYRWRIVDLE
jgi:hypothetical protein